MGFFASYREIWQVTEKAGGERNIFDFLIYRRISTVILEILKPCNFSPKYITTLSVAFSFLAACALFFSYERVLLYLGVILMNVSLVLDTLDGQYARMTDKTSEFGGWYDGVSDCLKYIFLFCGICWGLYYNPYMELQWLPGYLDVFAREPALVLIFGMLIIANLFMIYYVHVSRYFLSKNTGTVVNLKSADRRFHFGIESTLYTGFTVFLLLGQTYWLLVVLVASLPILWILPVWMVYRRYIQE